MDNTKDKLPDTVLHQQDGNLKGHFIIPEGIIEISDFAFYGCGIRTTGTGSGVFLTFIKSQ